MQPHIYPDEHQRNTIATLEYNGDEGTNRRVRNKKHKIWKYAWEEHLHCH